MSKLSLVTLLSPEQCSQFERFHLQHILMVSLHPVKNKMIDQNAEASRVNSNTLSHVHFPLQVLLCQFWAEEQALYRVSKFSSRRTTENKLHFISFIHFMPTGNTPESRLR